MQKDFKSWHKKKAAINDAEILLDFKEREIWLCHLGANIGHEQDGIGDQFLRPIIILRKFGNEVLWAIPLTTTRKEGGFYFQFSFRPPDVSTAILSQIRLIDSKRLKRKIGIIKKGDFIILSQKLDRDISMQ